MPQAVFAWEPFADLMASPNFAEMVREDHEELAVFKDEMPLDPDFKRYLEAEAWRTFRAFTARLGGELAGYVGFWFQPHIHYRGVMHVLTDLHYLAPQHRGNGLGSRFIDAADAAAIAEAHERGWRKVLLSKHFKLAKRADAHLRFFSAKGYKPTDQLLQRLVVGDGAKDGPGKSRE